MSCGGRRHSLDPTLLWLWCRPVATAPVQLLAGEPPYATGVSLKKQKKKEKKRKKNQRLWELWTWGGLTSLGLTGHKSGKYEALLHTSGSLHKSEYNQHHVIPDPSVFPTHVLKTSYQGVNATLGKKKLHKALCAYVSKFLKCWLTQIFVCFFRVTSYYPDWFNVYPTQKWPRLDNKLYSTLFVCGFSESLLLDANMYHEFLRGGFSLHSTPNLSDPTHFSPDLMILALLYTVKTCRLFLPLFIYLFIYFLWLKLWHVEVSRSGFEFELQM